VSERVLIVGCGFPQLSLIKRAKAMGVHVHGVDANARAVGVASCDSFECVSTSDADAIEAIVKREAIRAITSTGSELSVKTCAIVAARLSLPFYADPETVRRCQEKDAMRAAYAAAGLRVPTFARCTRVDEAQRFASQAGFPLVVKPSHGWGQRGVARVDSEAELARAFDDARAHDAEGRVVVEGWLEGREYSVNGWIEDGELASYCVTERITVPGKKPLGVMVAELYPSGLSREDEAIVVEEARRGARALGHTRGPCYSQVALSADKKPRLFETAARMGGGFDADVTLLASGVDLYARLLGVALGNHGLEAAGAKAVKYPAAIAKFAIAKPGVVRRVDGLSQARAMPGVVDAECFVAIGGEVFPLTDSAKRAAYVLAHGATREDVVARADAALAAIRMETAPKGAHEAETSP
jgi:biotin carboxylase